MSWIFFEGPHGSRLSCQRCFLLPRCHTSLFLPKPHNLKYDIYSDWPASLGLFKQNWPDWLNYVRARRSNVGPEWYETIH